MSNSELPLSGTTQIVGIFGWPVSHSFSPRMHNAAFRELGLDWAYVPFPTPPEKLGDAIRGFRAMGFRGANVTIPHKEKAIEFLDGLSPLSEKMGTVNTLYWEGDRLMGTTTDPWGCLENLRRAGFQPQNQDIALIGCGGAARAISFAFACDHPEMPITVVFRREDGDQAQRLQRELIGKTQAAVSLFPLEEFENRAGNFELVVNATPVGMHPNEGAVPFPTTRLHDGQCVLDIVYNPRRTQLLAEAQRHGCKTVEGLGMLLHQGAKSFELWTGKQAPVDAMARALDLG